MTTTEQINQFIQQNGGSERDAINVALARLENAAIEIARLKREVEYLYDELRRVTEK